LLFQKRVHRPLTATWLAAVNGTIGRHCGIGVGRNTEQPECRAPPPAEQGVPRSNTILKTGLENRPGNQLGKRDLERKGTWKINRLKNEKDPEIEKAGK
jgi:hypothetical protein